MPNSNLRKLKTSIHHELSKSSASADVQWFFLTRASPSGFSLRTYDEDLNFAEADSDLHRRNRSNRSRSERNGRAHVRRERIRNVNVCMERISPLAVDCILCRYLGRNYCLIPREQDWHVVYYSMRGLFDGKWWPCELPRRALSCVARCNSPRTLHRCEICRTVAYLTPNPRRQIRNSTGRLN